MVCLVAMRAPTTRQRRQADLGPDSGKRGWVAYTTAGGRSSLVSLSVAVGVAAARADPSFSRLSACRLERLPDAAASPSAPAAAALGPAGGPAAAAAVNPVAAPPTAPPTAGATVGANRRRTTASSSLQITSIASTVRRKACPAHPHGRNAHASAALTGARAAKRVGAPGRWWCGHPRRPPSRPFPCLCWSRRFRGPASCTPTESWCGRPSTWTVRGMRVGRRDGRGWAERVKGLGPQKGNGMRRREGGMGTEEEGRANKNIFTERGSGRK